MSGISVKFCRSDALLLSNPTGKLPEVFLVAMMRMLETLFCQIDRTLFCDPNERMG